ncbi:ATPase [Colletotrichum kahawae]|uniref:ATPase n=1 Tax=Colletotrichum kahawae TaxID=34407 RepID=A0AAD9YSK2_COLKA|nr:ATPase [Colletotrichum kahawae]
MKRDRQQTPPESVSVERRLKKPCENRDYQPAKRLRLGTSTATTTQIMPSEDFASAFVVHHVRCQAILNGHLRHDRSAVYQDAPRLYQGDSRASSLRGQMRLQNLDRYSDPDMNEGIVVLRDYEYQTFHKEVWDRFDRVPPPCQDPEIPDDLWPYFDILSKTTETAIATTERIPVSKHLRMAMDSVASGCPEPLANWEQGLFPPYVQLYYARSLIRTAADDLSDVEQRKHVVQLMDYVEDTFSTKFEEAENLFSQGLVTEDHLWMLFKPNEVVVTFEEGQPRGYVTNRSLKVRKEVGIPLRLDCYSWEFDGMFKRQDKVSGIERPSKDTWPLKIEDLPVFPLRLDRTGTLEETLQVKYIDHIEWNKKAFEQLVLLPEKKELIEAVIRGHMTANHSADVVEGKGKGVIILLHGGPGTGKTLTAESVAELAEKPLYRVTCGDIGTDPEKVEKYLDSVLFIGSIWEAVVLLDESDVFLEERQKMDLKRNALVSVFLRVLEYYKGILILTSNRVGHFDEAFKSRMQLALHYPPVDERGRIKIWNNLINLLAREQLRVGQLEDVDRTQLGDGERVNIEALRDNLNILAREKLNGRQIRNTITTARQLSRFRNKAMGFEHLEQTIRIANDFEEYVEKTHGHTAGEYAKYNEARLE